MNYFQLKPISVLLSMVLFTVLSCTESVKEEQSFIENETITVIQQQGSEPDWVKKPVNFEKIKVYFNSSIEKEEILYLLFTISDFFEEKNEPDTEQIKNAFISRNRISLYVVSLINDYMKNEWIQNFNQFKKDEKIDFINKDEEYEVIFNEIFMEKSKSVHERSLDLNLVIIKDSWWRKIEKKIQKRNGSIEKRMFYQYFTQVGLPYSRYIQLRDGSFLPTGFKVPPFLSKKKTNKLILYFDKKSGELDELNKIESKFSEGHFDRLSDRDVRR